VLEWYHLLLVHPGEKRMEATIRLVYTWPGMRTQVKERCKTCHECQMRKKCGNKKYGLLQEKKGEVIKWSRVNSFQAISVIRGARYGVFTNKKHALNTLTMDLLLRSDVMLP
jgi:positive regulator of sigma E activity